MTDAKIMDEHMFLSLWADTPHRRVLQHNNPKDTLKYPQDWFKWHKVCVVPWPSQSHELSGVEGRMQKI
jgi:hypothetical protein